MNILFLNSTNEKAWGGIEKWMLITAVGLREKGYNIFCGGKFNAIFTNRCKESGFVTFSMKFGVDFSMINSFRLSKILKEYQIDIVINHYNKEIKMASIARKILRRPIIIVARAGMPNVHNNWRYRLLYRRMVNGIITNAVAIKEKYMSYGWMEDQFIRLIRNGVDINVSAIIDRKAIEQKYNLPSHRPVLGIFGRLVSIKQHNLFLDVANNILREYPDAIFLIVGSGPLEEDIRQYTIDLGIEKNVFMLGFQSDLNPLYAFCDLVLLTSSYDGFPNVLMEAMAVGRPVITFDVGGVRELIQSERTGAIVPPNDVQTMTDKTLELIKSEEIREDIGREARTSMIENFSIAKMVDGVEDYLIQLYIKNPDIWS
ncbi:MAG: glycosyltransferase family 4 protein [Candidatus Neomarinimicrobiota bacterium]